MLKKKISSTIQLSKELGPLGPLVLFSVGAPVFGVMALVSGSNVWLPWLESLTYLQIPIYFLLAISLAGVSFIPTHATSLVGGMLFGLVEGPIYALVAVVGASYLSLKVISLFVKERTYNVILERPLAAKIHEELLNKSGLRAIWFVSLIRLSPVMPFAATNVLLAASKIKTHYFIWGSLIGLAPRVLIVAIAGAGLAELDFSKGSNIGLAILGLCATCLLIFYIGSIFKKVNRDLLNQS